MVGTTTLQPTATRQQMGVAVASHTCSSVRRRRRMSSSLWAAAAAVRAVSSSFSRPSSSRCPVTNTSHDGPQYVTGLRSRYTRASPNVVHAYCSHDQHTCFSSIAAFSCCSAVTRDLLLSCCRLTAAAADWARLAVSSSLCARANCACTSSLCTSSVLVWKGTHSNSPQLTALPRY